SPRSTSSSTTATCPMPRQTNGAGKRTKPRCASTSCRQSGGSRSTKSRASASPTWSLKCDLRATLGGRPTASWRSSVMSSIWPANGASANPTTGLATAPEAHRQRFLTPEETQRLIASINADQNQIAARAIILLLLTGARRSEVTQAKWEDVDWEKR